MRRRLLRETEIVAKFSSAPRFVDAAAIVCDRARALGVLACTLVLIGEDARPALTIDNDPELTDEERLAILATEHRLPDAADVPALVTPLIAPRGTFGSVTYAFRERATVALERELTILTTTLSVWCTDHGVGGVPRETPRETRRALPARQYQVARLAAVGQTNGEIADTLDISINTVKLRLKQVFERLRVNNRTELANVLRRLSALDGIPEGISSHGTIVIARMTRR